MIQCAGATALFGIGERPPRRLAEFRLASAAWLWCSIRNTSLPSATIRTYRRRISSRVPAVLGCDRAQGHYFSIPVPAEEFIDWIPGFERPALTAA